MRCFLIIVLLSLRITTILSQINEIGVEYNLNLLTSNFSKKPNIDFPVSKNFQGMEFIGVYFQENRFVFHADFGHGVALNERVLTYLRVEDVEGNSTQYYDQIRVKNEKKAKYRSLYLAGKMYSEIALLNMEKKINLYFGAGLTARYYSRKFIKNQFSQRDSIFRYDNQSDFENDINRKGYLGFGSSYNNYFYNIFNTNPFPYTGERKRKLSFFPFINLKLKYSGGNRVSWYGSVFFEPSLKKKTIFKETTISNNIGVNLGIQIKLGDPSVAGEKVKKYIQENES